MKQKFSLTEVLVVDDNRDAADSLVMLLTIWGYKVQAAYSGAEALKVATAFPPDCIFLDINMPAMDGCIVARLLRKNLKLRGVRLIALTAYSDSAHLNRILEAGFDFYLNKPADALRIRGILEEISNANRSAAKRDSE